MIQFSDPFETTEDFRSILLRVKSSPSFGSASDILAIAALGHQDPAFAEELIKIYDETVGRGSFCGYTAADVVKDGHMAEGENTLTFFLFDSSYCRVIPCDTELESSEEVGRKISKLIEDEKDSRVSSYTIAVSFDGGVKRSIYKAGYIVNDAAWKKTKVSVRCARIITGE